MGACRSGGGVRRCVLPLLLLLSVGAGAAGDHGVGGGDAGTEAKAAWTGGLSRRSFPNGFVFGTAASAYQVEGMALKDGRGPSIWDAFVKIPGEIANNATADVTVGVPSVQDGTGNVNWKGVAYYNRLIDYMLKIGITESVPL